MIASLLLLAIGAARAESPYLLISEAEANAMKASPLLREKLRSLCDREMKGGPWSVTYRRPEGLKISPNDYYSEGPYWWPDPKNPKGPYIRKDGQRNPNRFDKNRRDLGDMASAVLALGMGAWLFDSERYAGRAAKLVSVWFVDPATRMNPNLDYGQAVKGHNDGRGAGIIDTVSLIYAAQGMALLERSGKWNATDAAGARKWFTAYVEWLNTSKNGRDEQKAQNNHGTWWTSQVAAFAAFTHNSSMQRMMWERFHNQLVPVEIQPDGSCPREEARTNSLSYSTMNLDGFTVLCRLAEQDGQNLWKGTTLEKSFFYLKPYVLDPSKWKKQQISPYSANGTVFLGLAGMGLKSKELLDAYKSLPRSDSAQTLFFDLLIRSSGN